MTTLFLPHTTRDAENRLVTAFLPPAFQFSRRGAEWDKGERSNNAISSHTVRDAENRLVTSALLREKMGTLLPAKRYLYRVTTLFLPHTARDAENRLNTSFYNPRFHFRAEVAQRTRRGSRGVVTFFKE